MLSATALLPSARRPVRRVLRLRAGHAGFIWALSYVPIHVYWALGGATPAIGVTEPDSQFRVANWGASVLILGAGLMSLALTQRWGLLLPGALRRGVALVGAWFAILHFVGFSLASGMRLAGVLDYPSDADLTVEQMHNYDVANLLYFEPWFGIMGLLLVVAVRMDRRRVDTGSGERPPALPAWMPPGRTLRPTAVATLGVLACLHLAWGYGSDLLLPARATDTAPRLIELAELGASRPVAGVVTALLLLLAAAIAVGPDSARRRGAVILTLAGVLTVVWGVFTFDTWAFAGYGPALTAAGLLALAAHAVSHKEARGR